MKVEIDTDTLAAVISQAIVTALTTLDKSSDTEVKLPKKLRGRPPKINPLSDTYIKTMPIVNEKTALAAYQVPAKKTETPIQAKIADKPPRQQKFIDLSEVHDRVPAHKYPQPAERRPATRKLTFECSTCHKDFEAYPGEVPQAFTRERTPEGGESRPLVKCDDCAGRPSL